MIDDLMNAAVVPIFASSDAVFDGTRGLWTEEDAVNPILTYGFHKAAVEQYLVSKNAPWLVARLAKVVGAEPDTHSLLGEWVQNIEGGKTIRCATDQIFSPAHIDNVVDALLRLAEGAFTGLYNVCGPRALSRLEFLDLLVGEIRRYQKVRTDIVPCSIRDFPFLEARPLDTSMSPEKLYRALGITFDSMEVVCRRIVRERYGKGCVAQVVKEHACNEIEKRARMSPR
jgi:dTDP-4-dehydrorhamnose reductase